MTARAALALDLDDVQRLRRAVTQARAVGGDLGWLGEMLAVKLEVLPAGRLKLWESPLTKKDQRRLFRR